MGGTGVDPLREEELKQVPGTDFAKEKRSQPAPSERHGREEEDEAAAEVPLRPSSR